MRPRGHRHKREPGGEITPSLFDTPDDYKRHILRSLRAGRIPNPPGTQAEREIICRIGWAIADSIAMDLAWKGAKRWAI